jgi:hypothetical protein
MSRFPGQDDCLIGPPETRGPLAPWHGAVVASDVLEHLLRFYGEHYERIVACRGLAYRLGCTSGSGSSGHSRAVAACGEGGAGAAFGGSGLPSYGTGSARAGFRFDLDRRGSVPQRSDPARGLRATTAMTTALGPVSIGSVAVS